MLSKRLTALFASLAVVLVLGVSFFVPNKKTVANAEITYNDKSYFMYDVEIPFPFCVASNNTFTTLRLPYYPLKFEFTVDFQEAGVSAVYVPVGSPTTGSISWSKRDFTFNSSGYGSLTLVFPMATFNSSGGSSSQYAVLKVESQKSLYRDTGKLPLLTDYDYVSLVGDRPRSLTANSVIGYVNFRDFLEKYGQQCTLTLSTTAIENVYPNYYQGFSYHYDYLTEDPVDTSSFYWQGYDDGVESYQSELAKAKSAFISDWEQQHQDTSYVQLFGAVADTPVNIFKSFFDFEFLGLDMKSFICSILTLCLVVAVVKLLT